MRVWLKGEARERVQHCIELMQETNKVINTMDDIGNKAALPVISVLAQHTLRLDFERVESEVRCELGKIRIYKQ